MQIILAGLSKIDENNTDEGLDELPENNCALNAGYALESVSRVIKDNVL